MTLVKILEILRNLLIFLLILGSAVLVHELGHFLVALLRGVRIKEIGLGIPPRIAKLGEWRGAEITLNWIPLGGFVRPEGEYDTEVADGFSGHSPWGRILILSAGAIANLLFGFFILTAAFVVGGPDEELVRVVEVFPDSPAEEIGLLPDDLVLEVDGVLAEGPHFLRDYLHSHRGEEITLHVEREGDPLKYTLNLRREFPENEGPAGFASRGVIVRHSLMSAAGEAIDAIVNVVRETGKSISAILIGGTEAEESRLVGPVGLKQISDWALDASVEFEALYPVLYVWAMVSIGLGLTNLLPIPALDGGRIVFATLEILRGKPLPIRVERGVQVAGALTLIALMLYLTVQDILYPLF